MACLASSPGCDSSVLVVMCQAQCLASNELENVVDEGVHDSHGLGRDAGDWMDLLQHLVHVHGVALLAAALALLAVLLLGLGHSFFRAFLGAGADMFRFRHVYNDNTQQHRKILKCIGGLLIGLISMCCVSEIREALKQGEREGIYSSVLFFSLFHENISRSYRNPPDKL